MIVFIRKKGLEGFSGGFDFARWQDFHFEIKTALYIQKMFTGFVWREMKNYQKAM